MDAALAVELQMVSRNTFLFFSVKRAWSDSFYSV